MGGNERKKLRARRGLGPCYELGFLEEGVFEDRSFSLKIDLEPFVSPTCRLW